jgi:hypothetical protein
VTKILISYKGFKKMKVLTRLIWSTCVLSLLVVGCGGGSSGERPDSLTSPNVNGTPSLKRVYPYQAISNSEQVLLCSKLFLDSDSCNVADIRPIGASITGDVSLEDIKSRLVISHDWMAESFIAALEQINDQDLLNLFKPLNTIVISYDIRPSFYHPLTASMYIDARYLWRNSYEWETIYKQDDYRSGYQSEFIFDALLRYVNSGSNNYVTWSNIYNANSYSNRSSEQIAPGLFRLLSHELAHANDYLSSEFLTTLGDNGKIFDDYISSTADINDELSKEYRLNSDLLYEAARIAYGGAEMTDRIRNTSAEEAGSAFKYDGAADLYGYTTAAEDVAMLFEAFMMYKKYQAVSDVAFVTIPVGENVLCDDYVVKWGQRNRLADSKVKQRAELVARMILARDISADLPPISSAPVDMRTNIGWCESRVTTIASSERLNRTYSTTSQQVIHDYRDDLVRE